MKRLMNAVESMLDESLDGFAAAHAVPNSTWSTGRRGVAGTLVVEKIVGEAAEQSVGLEDLRDLGRQVNDRTRSCGIALSPCTVPAAGKSTFDLGPDETEAGVGVYGEPSRRRSNCPR